MKLYSAFALCFLAATLGACSNHSDNVNDKSAGIVFTPDILIEYDLNSFTVREFKSPISADEICISANRGNGGGALECFKSAINGQGIAKPEILKVLRMHTGGSYHFYGVVFSPGADKTKICILSDGGYAANIKCRDLGP